MAKIGFREDDGEGELSTVVYKMGCELWVMGYALCVMAADDLAVP
jgi:hypothetical protein